MKMQTSLRRWFFYAIPLFVACMPVPLDPIYPEPQAQLDHYSGEEYNTVEEFNIARAECQKKGNRIREEHDKLARRIWVGWFVPALIGLVGSVASVTTATLTSQDVIKGKTAAGAAMGSSIGVTTAATIGVFVRSAAQAPERSLGAKRARYFEIQQALSDSWTSFSALDSDLINGEEEARERLRESLNKLRGECAASTKQTDR